MAYCFHSCARFDESFEEKKIRTQKTFPFWKIAFNIPKIWTKRAKMLIDGFKDVFTFAENWKLCELSIFDCRHETHKWRFDYKMFCVPFERTRNQFWLVFLSFIGFLKWRKCSFHARSHQTYQNCRMTINAKALVLCNWFFTTNYRCCECFRSRSNLSLDMIVVTFGGFDWVNKFYFEFAFAILE